MPLTTTGIAIQILSSIRARRAHVELCTVNDCKVAVNHLIRKFSEPLGHPKRQSTKVISGQVEKTIKDHAVPVIVILEQLLEWPDSTLDVSVENLANLEKFLRESLLIVEVTPEEDRILSLQGFQRKMPVEWATEGHPLYRDPLARYKICNIEV